MKHSKYITILPLAAVLTLTGCMKKKVENTTACPMKSDTTNSPVSMQAKETSNPSLEQSITQIAENAKQTQDTKIANITEMNKIYGKQLDEVLDEPEMSKLYSEYGRPDIWFQSFAAHDEITYKDGISINYGLSKDDMRKALARGLGEYRAIVGNNIQYP